MSDDLKFGKLPAQRDQIKFKLKNYIDRSALPPLPQQFGPHVSNRQEWGLLANDRYGCCVWSGAAHEHMMWCARAKKQVRFTDDNILADYAAVTGFDPRTGSGDNGTVVAQAAAYRRNVGILDADGHRHKVSGYLDLDPGDIHDLWYAVYLFGAVGIGFEVPGNAVDQFRRGSVWNVVSQPQSIHGGHYVPLVDKNRNGIIVAVTWGRLQGMTTQYYQKYNDETVAYVSEDALTNNKSPEGFDADQLLADLQALGK